MDDKELQILELLTMMASENLGFSAFGKLRFKV